MHTAEYQKLVDLRTSSTVDVSSIRSVCLLFGPYRNLTTLTASILALHPNCQVLNHAGFRIFGDPRLDFLVDYTDQKFLDFLKFAVHISQGGRKGQYGGSILLSHAFDERYPLRKLYHQRFGERLIKEEICCLFWKESLRLSNLIRAGCDLTGILAQNQALRFMLPIRNPIDCAFSNLRTGHLRIFPNLSQSSPVEEVISAILDDFAWFDRLRQARPDRFAYFFEHEFHEAKLLAIADFLDLDYDAQWRRDALSAFVDQSKTKYTHRSALIKFYKDQVEMRFAENSDFRRGLLKFVE
jgi:hypothetical protein